MTSSSPLDLVLVQSPRGVADRLIQMKSGNSDAPSPADYRDATGHVQPAVSYYDGG